MNGEAVVKNRVVMRKVVLEQLGKVVMVIINLDQEVLLYKGLRYYNCRQILYIYNRIYIDLWTAVYIQRVIQLQSIYLYSNYINNSNFQEFILYLKQVIYRIYKYTKLRQYILNLYNESKIDIYQYYLTLNGR